MQRLWIGAWVGLLLGVPICAQDKPPEKPAAATPAPQTPAEKFRALSEEQAKALTSFMEEYRKAKTDAEKQKLFQEKYPRPDKYAERYLAIAEEDPKGPFAVDALMRVVTGSPANSPAGKKALDLLLTDHIASEKLGMICSRLAYNGPEGLKTLRTILEKSPNHVVQGQACLALAQATLQFAQGDAAQEKEAEALFERFVNEFGDMSSEKLAQICAQLAYSGPPGQKALRVILAKNSNHDVQGQACLALAQAIKQSAEGDAAQEKEAEDLFDRVVNEFGDVKSPRGGLLADTAKSELNDIRLLGVGKPAPEIEGEDIDAKPMKLSDFKGKVVLLDFWGDW